MRIDDTAIGERMVRALTELDARRIISSTMTRPKSVAEISQELSIAIRTVYRHVNELCALGLLTSERRVLMDTGGKYVLYRSMVKSVSFRYDGDANALEVDLLPNESSLERFMRFWTYLGK